MIERCGQLAMGPPARARVHHRASRRQQSLFQEQRNQVLVVLIHRCSPRSLLAAAVLLCYSSAWDLRREGSIFLFW